MEEVIKSEAVDAVEGKEDITKTITEACIPVVDAFRDLRHEGEAIPKAEINLTYADNEIFRVTVERVQNV